MSTINLEGVLNACDTLQRRTIMQDGCMHSSVRCFDACMRAFTGKPAAEAITFRIYLNAPVMRPGEATIHRDGAIQMRTI